MYVYIEFVRYLSLLGLVKRQTHVDRQIVDCRDPPSGAHRHPLLIWASDSHKSFGTELWGLELWGQWADFMLKSVCECSTSK